MTLSVLSKLPKNTSTIEQASVDNNQITVHHSVQEQHYKVVFPTNDPPDEGTRIIENLPPPAAEDPQQGPAVFPAIRWCLYDVCIVNYLSLPFVEEFAGVALL